MVSPPSSHWARLGIYLAVLSFESVVISTQLNYIRTNWFARSHLAPGEEPPDCNETPTAKPCKEGAANVAFWNGFVGGAAGFLSIFTSVAMGSASDKFGRRTMLVAKAALNMVKIATLLLVVVLNMSLWVYMLIEALDTLADVKGVTAAIFADLTKDYKKQRGAVFGVAIVVVISFGSVFLPVASRMTYAIAITVGTTAAAIRLFCAVFVLPETQELGDAKAKGDVSKHTSVSWTPCKSLSLLCRNSFTLRMSVILVLNVLAHAGIHTVMQSYFLAHFGMRKQDMASFAIATLPSIMICFTFGLWFLLPRIGEVRVVQVSFMFSIALTMTPVLATEKWHLFVGYGILAGPGFLLLPVINAVKSNLCADEEQGRIQGLIAALIAISTSVSNIGFGYLYKKATNDGDDVDRATILFWLSMFLTCLAASLSWTLPLEYPTPRTDKGDDKVWSEARGLQLAEAHWLPNDSNESPLLAAT